MIHNDDDDEESSIKFITIFVSIKDVDGHYCKFKLVLETGR